VDALHTLRPSPQFVFLLCTWRIGTEPHPPSTRGHDCRATKCTIQFAHVYYPLPQPASGEAGKTLPDRIAEHFIARIFTGEIAAGERLPPDRELAPLLGVDRTSLRMAMQQLSRLGLIKVVHGSGVRVLDYREHAGIDFLAAVFALPDLFLGGSFLLQVLDDWLDLMPAVIGRALARATHDDYRSLDGVMAEQLALLEAEATPATLAELEVALQDRLVRVLGNTGLVLLGNSSRPLRQRLVQMFFEEVAMREHVEMQRALLRESMNRASVSPLSAPEIATFYRAYLLERSAPLRRRLSALPMNPALLRPHGATIAREAPSHAPAKTPRAVTRKPASASRRPAAKPIRANTKRTRP
jgi:GntR family transcriptional repressor for pyruvate dehydrogenase complex